MGILIFVPELDCDLVLGPSEEFFTEAVVLLLLPFLGEEVDDLFSSVDEPVSVAPDTVLGISQRYFGRVSGFTYEKKQSGV